MKSLLLATALVGTMLAAGQADAATKRQIARQEQYQHSQETKFCELVKSLSYDAMDARQHGHFYQEYLGTAKRSSESFTHFSNESSFDRRYPLHINSTTFYLVKERVGLKTYEARLQNPGKWSETAYSSCLAKTTW